MTSHATGNFRLRLPPQVRVFQNPHHGYLEEAMKIVVRFHFSVTLNTKPLKRVAGIGSCIYVFLYQ